MVCEINWRRQRRSGQERFHANGAAKVVAEGNAPDAQKVARRFGACARVSFWITSF
jgi:hypothetical protein